MKERLFKVDSSTTPDFPGLMLATILALRELGGSAKIAELDTHVIEEQALTEEEQSYMMPDGKRPRVNYFLAWARTYLRMTGFVENPSRRVWALNKIADNATLEICQEAFRTVNSKGRVRRRDRSADDQDRTNIGNLTDTDTVISSDAGVGAWEVQLLDALGSMAPDAFERLSQRLLREAGFTKVEVRGKTGDGGLDGVGVLRVNLVSFQIYFQCKRWKGSVGAREIRDFRGALQGRADKGLFITTGTYTAQATEEATRDGAIAIDLIDGDRLCELLKSQKLGVSTKLVEEVEVDSDWFARF